MSALRKPALVSAEEYFATEVETLTADADVLRVPDLGFEMKLAEVYEKVEFAARAELA